jgi:hypothetical protein
MRRGCLSVGTVNCDICKRKIPYPERYVMVDEDAKGHEVEKGGKSVRYCIECATKKGYAHTKEIKGEMMLTFLRESEAPPSTATPPPAAETAAPAAEAPVAEIPVPEVETAPAKGKVKKKK